MLWMYHPTKATYFMSSLVNEYPSWASTFTAIWFVHGNLRIWAIGYLTDVGQYIAGIYSTEVDKCPFEIPSEQWYYYVGFSWILAGQNDIKVECVAGNHLYTVVFIGK